MAGKISLVLNIILAAAVLYLFTQIGEKDKAPSDKEITADPAKDSYPSIAYVNNDSLSMNYKFRQDKSKILEQASNDASAIEGRITKAQEEYYEIMTKAQTGGFSSDSEIFTAEKRVEQLEKDMPYLQRQMEQKMKRLTSLEAEINDSLYARLYRFIDQYSSDKGIDVVMLYSKGLNGLYSNGDLEITEEVINGLNDAYEKESTAE